jgi:ATP-binding cassette subfamily B protein
VKLYRQTDDSEGRMTDKISKTSPPSASSKPSMPSVTKSHSFEDSLTDYKEKFIRWRKLSAFFFSSSDIFVFGSKLARPLYGIYLCYAEYQVEINPGTLVLSFQLRQHDGLAVTRMSRPPFRIWANTSPRATGSASFLKNRSKIRPRGLTPAIKGDIVFDHVGFKYDDADHEVIHDVSFSSKRAKPSPSWAKPEAASRPSRFF